MGCLSKHIVYTDYKKTQQGSERGKENKIERQVDQERERTEKGRRQRGSEGGGEK